jgi:hypothetical protein
MTNLEVLTFPVINIKTSPGVSLAWISDNKHFSVLLVKEIRI